MKTRATPDHLSPTGASYWEDKNGVPHLNFAWAERHYAALEPDSLRFVIADCRAAMEANPENRKNGLYADTIHVVSAILARRAKEPTP